LRVEDSQYEDGEDDTEGVYVAKLGLKKDWCAFFTALYV
jgi:hypothetical protein